MSDVRLRCSCGMVFYVEASGLTQREIDRLRCGACGPVARAVRTNRQVSHGALRSYLAQPVPVRALGMGPIFVFVLVGVEFATR
jgi:hypothetical protein